MSVEYRNFCLYVRLAHVAYLLELNLWAKLRQQEEEDPLRLSLCWEQDGSEDVEIHFSWLLPAHTYAGC